jgi:hypothetical protein
MKQGKRDERERNSERGTGGKELEKEGQKRKK